MPKPAQRQSKRSVRTPISKRSIRSTVNGDPLLLHESVDFEHHDYADGFDTYDERVVHMRLTLH